MSGGMEECSAKYKNDLMTGADTYLKQGKEFNPAPPKLTWDEISDIRHRVERIEIAAANVRSAARELKSEIDLIIEGVENGTT